MAKLPSIIIAGFQKCGTTALFEILRHHPEIETAVNLPANNSVPGPKEIHFFNEDEAFAKGLGWYASLFGDGPNPAMEATPEYIVRKKSIRRLGQNLPDARIILMMRDPIDRAYSAWNHLNQLPEESRWPLLIPDGDLGSNVRAEIHRYIDRRPGEDFEGGGFYKLVSRGFYIRQIDYLDSFYDPDQIYLGFSDNLKNDHANEIAKIQEFLGVEVCPLDRLKAHVRSYNIPPMSRRTRILLEEVFAPFDGRLEERVGRRPPWR